MKKLILGVLSAFTLFVAATHAAPLPADKLKVVATIPDLADIVREVGGERVDVSAITKGRENLHLVTARPSHLVALSRADLFVQVGLSLEVAFVPGLMEAARNRKIQPGQPGFVNASEGWDALDKPATVSRQAGDVHPQGNPHMNLDPKAGRFLAERIRDGLVRVDPGSKSEYEQRFAAYAKKLDDAEARWSEAEKSWAGKKVVVYHQEYGYLCRACGIEILGAIEVKPGIPPTPNHLAELIATMKQQGCTTILTAAWSNNDEVERVASAAGAKVVELPNQCGGLSGTDTWIGMMDLVHKRIGEALGTAKAP
ncbi:MAG: zinc ABC transporter substrate-binding protein [Planctomycetes bacterium]|nr:zinc ABC transporter substrate-binding protein [Planctomycetota bacterium]